MKTLEQFKQFQLHLIGINQNLAQKIDELYQNDDPSKDFVIEPLYHLKNKLTFLIAGLAVRDIEHRDLEWSMLKTRTEALLEEALGSIEDTVADSKRGCLLFIYRLQFDLTNFIKEEMVVAHGFFKPIFTLDETTDLGSDGLEQPTPQNSPER